jgi:hypothetical protein
MSISKHEYYLTTWLKHCINNHKTLLFIDQCTNHTSNATFLRYIKDLFLLAKGTSQPQPLHLGITDALSAITESSWFRRPAIYVGGMLQDAIGMKMDVLSEVHFTAGARNMITHAKVKNCFVTCAFLIDHVNCNDDIAVKQQNWRGWLAQFNSWGMQFEEYTTSESAIEVCGI